MIGYAPFVDSVIKTVIGVVLAIIGWHVSEVKGDIAANSKMLHQIQIEISDIRRIESDILRIERRQTQESGRTTEVARMINEISTRLAVLEAVERGK